MSLPALDLPAVDPRVIAADQPGPSVDGRDDDSVVRNGVGQELPEPVVNRLELERLVQVARSRKEKLRSVIPRMTNHFTCIMP